MLTKYNFYNYYTLGTTKIDVLEAFKTEAAEAASINNQTNTTPSIWLSGSRVSTKNFQLKHERLPVAAAIPGMQNPAKPFAIATDKPITDASASLIIE
jgi:hypothetical protein